MTGLCVFALSCLIFFIAIGRVVGGVLLVAICAVAWRMYIWPRQKGRYLDAISDLPTWQIEAD